MAETISPEARTDTRGALLRDTQEAVADARDKAALKQIEKWQKWREKNPGATDEQMKERGEKAAAEIKAAVSAAGTKGLEAIDQEMNFDNVPRAPGEERKTSTQQMKGLNISSLPSIANIPLTETWTDKDTEAAQKAHVQYSKEQAPTTNNTPAVIPATTKLGYEPFDVSGINKRAEQESGIMYQPHLSGYSVKGQMAVC